MPTAGRELTDQHRREQLAIRASAIRAVQQVWAGFDLSDIDGSWQVIAPALEAITRDYAAQSARQSADYYRAFRTAEGAPGSPSVRMAEPPSPDALRYSLGYYGRIVPKKLIATGRTDVARQSLVHMSGGVSRHALNGGRDTMVGSVRDDRQARGWQRITAARPCSFCAMVAARGSVYRETTVDFKTHDHCVCTVEPVYRDTPPNPQNEEFSRQWDESQRLAREAGDLHRGTSNDALNAFRRYRGGL